jgi:hypothetical protein
MNNKHLKLLQNKTDITSDTKDITLGKFQGKILS